MADAGATFSAELSKLRTLPSASLTVATTVTAATVLAAVAGRTTAGPVAATLVIESFVQVGFVVLGALATGSNHAGGQMRASLLAVPRRPLLLAGQLAAYTVVGATAAGLTVAGGTLAAQLVGRSPTPGWRLTAPLRVALVGAAAYLVVIGLLSALLAALVRSSLGAAAGMSTLLLIISPLLQDRTRAARYLPDVAAARWYQPAPDPAANVGTAAAVVVAVWTLALLLTLAVTMQHRDGG